MAQGLALRAKVEFMAGEGPPGFHDTEDLGGNGEGSGRTNLRFQVSQTLTF